MKHAYISVYQKKSHWEKEDEYLIIFSNDHFPKFNDYVNLKLASKLTMNVCYLAK